MSRVLAAVAWLMAHWVVLVLLVDAALSIWALHTVWRWAVRRARRRAVAKEIDRCREQRVKAAALSYRHGLPRREWEGGPDRAA